VDWIVELIGIGIWRKLAAEDQRNSRTIDCRERAIYRSCTRRNQNRNMYEYID